MKAAVIGSGVGGLAMAIRLAHKGFEVTVFEKNDHAGGKMSEIRGDGFRFDTGPSLFTLPELADELIELTGEKTEDYLQYTKLDNICTYFYEDGTRIRAFGDQQRFANEIEEKTVESTQKVLRHLKKCRVLYDLTADIFLFNSLHRINTYLKWKVIKAVMLSYKLDALTTMHKRNASRFRDPRVIQLFNRYATYNGSNPYDAPATLNVIGHLEHSMGAYFPVKGMRSLATGLESLARKMGVRFQFESRVDRIIVEKNRVTAVEVKNEKYPFELIVSDSDIHLFYQNLLPGVKPYKTNEKNLSSSALIFYWGIRGKFPSLGLHNILFSEDYEAEFQHIFHDHIIYRDPTIYIFISSREVPSDAPENAENWFVMINVPPDTGQDWEKLIAKARHNIIQKINRFMETSIEDMISFEQVGSPRTIEQNTLSWKGALYGDHSNSRYSAFLRHSYKHGSIKNLYFVGGSVHPGGGIPLCLASAKIVDQVIKPI
jgi:phytoene desaturase